MEFSVTQSLLNEHLQIAARALPAKSPHSIVEGMLFVCEGNLLTLTATNLELGIRTTLPQNCAEEGRVVLPGKVAEVVKRLAGDDVYIKINPENFQTEIKSGSSEFQLFGMDASEYPVFPEIGPDQTVFSFDVKAEHLRRALRQTLFCISHDESKPTFTGVLFSLSEDSLSLYSTDTFRLAVTVCGIKNHKKTGKFLVPGKSLQEMIKTITADEENIHIAVAQNQLVCLHGQRRYALRLLEDSYPDVERVIPNKFIGEAVMDTSMLTLALERIALLSEGTNHVARLDINSERLVLRASSRHGKTQEILPLQLTGEGMEISLNTRFLLDMLRVCEGEKCFLQLTGVNKPCILRDSLYDDYCYMVLPIKV